MHGFVPLFVKVCAGKIVSNTVVLVLSHSLSCVCPILPSKFFICKHEPVFLVIISHDETYCQIMTLLYSPTNLMSGERNLAFVRLACTFHFVVYKCIYFLKRLTHRPPEILTHDYMDNIEGEYVDGQQGE